MRGFWTNVAKQGDPSGPGLPRWPRYGVEAIEVTLDRRVTSGEVDPWRSARCDLWDGYAEANPGSYWARFRSAVSLSECDVPVSYTHLTLPTICSV